MFLFLQFFVLINLINYNEACNIQIPGACPDLATKLTPNFLAMGGKWYEVMRNDDVTPLQFGTSCVSLNFTNVGRHELITHNYKTILGERRSLSSIFNLHNEPTIEVTFMPGVTRTLTLMGTDYLNFAVFYRCTQENSSKLNSTSNICFWIYSRQNTLLRTSRKIVEFLFKLRNVEDLLNYLTSTKQDFC